MFLSLLGRREFAASHEARVAQAAREMAASGWPWNATPVSVPRTRVIKSLGAVKLMPQPQASPIQVNPWIVPILDGEIRLQKPPLPYWFAAVLFRLFGVSEAAARAVPAIMAVIATLLIFDLGQILYGRTVASVAALLWATNYIASLDYRLAMADPYLGFFTLLGLLAWVRRRSSLWLILFYISIGLGFLAKGPLIFLDLGIPIALLRVCVGWASPTNSGGQSPPYMRWIAHVLGIALLLAIALPWPIVVIHQVPGILSLWRYESLGEFTGEKQEGLRAAGYYLQNLPLLALPWAALWIASIVYAIKKRTGRVLLPFLWYVLIIAIFSVAGQKKLPYLLPMLPAQSLLIAIAAVPLLRQAAWQRMGGWPGVVIVAQVVIGFGWAIVAHFLVHQIDRENHLALVLSMLPMLIALVPIIPLVRARPWGWLASQSIAYAAVLLCFTHLYLTPLNNERSPKKLCEELMASADGQHRAILEKSLPEEVAFYLPLHPPQGIAPSEYLTVIDDQRGVLLRLRTHQPPPQPTAEEFQSRVADAEITSVRRLDLPAASGDSRYKVYLLTVRRRTFAVKLTNSDG